jgi:hypothetical protein
VGTAVAQLRSVRGLASRALGNEYSRSSAVMRYRMDLYTVPVDVERRDESADCDVWVVLTEGKQVDGMNGDVGLRYVLFLYQTVLDHFPAI